MTIEQEIVEIKERNKRVEADKAWETSYARIGTLTVTTYIIAVIVMKVIGVTNYFESALIPAIGYFLSTRSLPLVKKYWITHFYSGK